MRSAYAHAYDGRPNTAFGRISLFDNFQVQASYTLSKVMDTTPDGTSVVPGSAGDDSKVAQDTLLPNLDRGLGQADIRHRFVFSGVWDLNYARSLHSAAARGLLGGWQLGLISQIQSGRPLQDITSGDPGGDTITANDRTPGVGRNTLVGPEFATVDVRLSKVIGLVKERVKLRLMGEGFNLTNRANFNGIQGTHYTQRRHLPADDELPGDTDDV